MADTEGHVVYFYVSQKEVERSESIDIFRCLIGRLAWSPDGDPIAAVAKAMYDERARDRVSGRGKPSLGACITILRRFCDARPWTELVIDALDECLLRRKCCMAWERTQRPHK